MWSTGGAGTQPRPTKQAAMTELDGLLYVFGGGVLDGGDGGESQVCAGLCACCPSRRGMDLATAPNPWSQRGCGAHGRWGERRSQTEGAPGLSARVWVDSLGFRLEGLGRVEVQHLLCSVVGRERGAGGGGG